MENIAQVSKSIYDKGLVSGKAGNISVRSGDVVAITPTLKSLGNLTSEDIVLVDLTGKVLTKGKPSSEVNMHLEIYKARSDVKSIVHTHSPYATGFAFSQKKLKRLEGFGEIKNPYIQSVEYEKPGSMELALSVRDKIKDEDVLILKNHGVICVGDTLDEAMMLSVFIEESAKTQFITHALNLKE